MTMACLFASFCSQYLWGIISLSIGIASYYYFSYKRVFRYWKSRNISGPEPIPIFGNFLTLILKPWNLVEVDRYRKYGRIYGTFTGKKPGLTIAEPELVKQVMVKDFHIFHNRRNNPNKHKIFSKNMFVARDDDWKRIRAIASPTFTSGKLRKMYGLINECCNDFIDNLDELANKGKKVELKELMGAYTMDVISRTAFASKTNTYKDPNNPFIRAAHAIFNAPLWKFIIMITLPTFLTKFQWIRELIVSSDSSQFFVDYSQQLIKRRKQNNEKHNDFLQLLMDVERSDGEVRDENDANEAHHVNEGIDERNADIKAFSNVLEKKLTEDEVLAQCFVFFLAGYETTATALSYCMYELAVHPELQERLRKEVREASDERGDISYETLSKLSFLDSLISETLRFYPPLIRLEREASEDVVLGDTGIKIEKGNLVEIPVYAIHHDPEFYPEPEVFKPDRFMPQNIESITPYTYLPFGSGPRNCIGMRFALLEAKLALARISQKFNLFKVSETDVPVVYNRGRFLLQAKRLVIGVERL